MTEYFLKETHFKANQWLKNGDHREVSPYQKNTEICRYCGKPLSEHGTYFRKLVSVLICPSDWLVKDPDNDELTIYSNKQFVEGFEKAEEK